MSFFETRARLIVPWPVMALCIRTVGSHGSRLTDPVLLRLLLRDDDCGIFAAISFVDGNVTLDLEERRSKLKL